HYHTRLPALAPPLRGDHAARTRDALGTDPAVSRACKARNHPDLCGLDDGDDQGELPEGPGTVSRAVSADCCRIMTVTRYRKFLTPLRWVAYSGRRLPLIPVETCHRFQAKVATDSD